MNASRIEEFETVAAVNNVQAVIKVSMNVEGKKGNDPYQRWFVSTMYYSSRGEDRLVWLVFRVGNVLQPRIQITDRHSTLGDFHRSL